MIDGVRDGIFVYGILDIVLPCPGIMGMFSTGICQNFRSVFGQLLGTSPPPNIGQFPPEDYVAI